MEAIGLAFIGAVTEAVFGHLLPKAEPKLREWLGRDPAKLAFQTAFAQSYTRFDRSHHEWTAALFDDAFLCRPDVSWELSRLLTEGEAPDVGAMARAWAEYFAAGRRERRVEEITPVIADFLAGLRGDLRQQEALRPAYDSKALDGIAASNIAIASDTAELRRLLEQALAVARLSHTHTTIVHAYPALQDYSYDFGDAIARVTRWFVGREPLFVSLDAFIHQHPCGYFRIEAGAGLGKTAIAAALAQRYEALVHFFSASEGITSPDRCLNHLCAQLIARFELPHTHLPERAGADAAFFRSLLAEAAARQDGRPLVLVVDALDEAEPAPPGHNSAHLPASLPQGVYIALTHRPGDYPLQTEAATRVRPYAIAWNDDNQQDDIEQHLRRQAERPEIRRALEGASPPLTPDRFVAALKQRSEGNFKYLDYVLADIESREPGFDPLHLAGLPQGLGGYYEHFWQRMEAAGKAEGWAEWRGLYKPVLSYLAAAGEAVTALWLAVQARRPADELLERVLSPWQRFLRRQRQDGRETWAIVHQSFADFVATKLDLTAAHQAIARYYLDFPTLWPDENGYAFRHLSAHLAQAGMEADLGDLIENRAWYKAQRDHDPSLAAFAEDVNRALALAEKRGLDGLPQVVAWSLLYATVRTRATQIPIEALETMVLLGEGERALRYAALITDPERQSQAYLRLAEQFRSSNDGTRSLQALHTALVAAENIGDDLRRAKALATVAQALAQAGERAKAIEVSQRARAAVESVGEDMFGSRVEVLVGVAQALALAGEFDQVLAVGESIGASRAVVLAGVAQALAETGERAKAIEVSQRALATVENIGSNSRRAKVLVDVAQALAQVGERTKTSELLQQALAAAVNIEYESPREDALLVVAQALAQVGEFDRALTVAAGIGAEWGRAAALASVAQALAQVGDFERALAVAEGIGWEWSRAAALASVAQALALAGEEQAAGVVWQESLAAAASIGHVRSRAALLAGVAQALAQASEITQADKLLQQALAAAESIGGDEWNRGRALVAVAEALTYAGSVSQASAVWQQALAVAESADGEWWCGEHLAHTALALAQAGDLAQASEVWERALVVAASSADELVSGRALLEVTRSLTKADGRIPANQGLQRVLAAVDTIDDEEWRAEVLAGVAEALAEAGEKAQTREVGQQALAVAASIGDEEWRASMLVLVARALAQAGEKAQASELGQQTLVAAQSIGNEESRAKVLAGVAEALAEAGEFDQAMAVEESIGDEKWRARMLVLVAGALTRAGEKAMASEVGQRALVAAQSIGNEASRIPALQGAARALAEVGEFNQAMTVAESISHEEERAEILMDVGLALAQAGKVAEAGEVWSLALAEAGNIEGEWSGEVVAGVALVLALAQGTQPGDEGVTDWVRDVFTRAQVRGSAEVFRYIEVFAPVLTKLGVISATWDRLQAVEAVLSGQPLLVASSASSPAPA